MKNLKRKYIQLVSALLYNANLKGFTTGKIYKGKTKSICVPGLNCYSCPGAIASCPLGTLQNGISNISNKAPYYILGLLLLFGLLLGRMICGFLCPFGLIQELLYKIPLRKLRKNRITKYLSYIKYILLAVFVILIPLMYTYLKKMSVPAFCKYICPAGTLEAGIPLVVKNKDLQKVIGVLFDWKLFVMVIIIISCIFIYRSFCRFLCPLGAIYSLFASISLFGIKVEDNRCNHCNHCIHSCKMDIKKVGDYECIQCGECIGECSQNAIRWKSIRDIKIKGEN